MKGWEIKKLGEVLQKTETIDPTKEPEKEFTYIDVSSVNNQKFFVENTSKIIGKNAPSRARKLIRTNDVIFATVRPTLKRVAIIDETFDKQVCSTGYFVLRPKGFIDYKFLFYYLLSDEFSTNMESLQKGASYPAVTDAEIRNQLISYPPLSIQQEIVSILEETFEAIAQVKANAEQNLKNAKELFESYLQSVFENKGDGWEEKRLDEICVVKDGTHDSPKYFADGIPFVTQKNIKSDGLSFDDTRFIKEEDHEKFYKRSNVAFGDILISMIGANRGMAAIVDDKRIFSIKNVGLIKASEKINKHFLLYFLKSPLAMKYVLYMSNGGAQEFVGLTALRSFPIPFPLLKEQQTIVKKLDALSAETKRLEAIYQQKLKDVEELKKAILEKAFKGELTGLSVGV